MHEKDFNKIEMMNNVFITVFAYQNKLVFPTCVSYQYFKDSMDLLMLKNDNNSHYVYIKDFDRFMFHKTKIETKNDFIEVVYSVLVENVC